MRRNTFSTCGSGQLFSVNGNGITTVEMVNAISKWRQSSLIDLCGRHRNFGQKTRRRAYRTIRRSHNCPIEHWSSRLRPIFHKKIFSSRRNLYRRSWEKSAQFCFFRFLSIEKIHFFLEIRLFLGFFPKSRLKKN